MSLFKGIALFIGWVTSSFAGIAAILYACGYLISRAQLRALGLFGIVERTPDYYLQEGANFFVGIMGLCLPLLFPWLFWAGCIFLFLLVLGTPAAIYLFKKKDWVRRFLQSARWRIARTLERQPWFWRTAAFLLLLCVLIFYLTRYMNEFTPALEVSNLLYGNSGALQSPRSVELAGWILADQRDKLEGQFLRLLWGTLQAGVVLALAWQAIRPARLRLWLVTPFGVVFLLYGFFLPLSYGVLVHRTRLPVIALTSASHPIGGVRGDLFLLNKTEHEFVLWDGKAQRVLWIASDQVQAAEVREIRFLFAKRGGGS